MRPGSEAQQKLCHLDHQTLSFHRKAASRIRPASCKSLTWIPNTVSQQCWKYFLPIFPSLTGGPDHTDPEAVWPASGYLPPWLLPTHRRVPLGACAHVARACDQLMRPPWCPALTQCCDTPSVFTCSNSGKLPLEFPLQWRKAPLAPPSPSQPPCFSIHREPPKHILCSLCYTVSSLRAETGPFSSLRLGHRGQCTVWGRNSETLIRYVNHSPVEYRREYGVS